MYSIKKGEKEWKNSLIEKKYEHRITFTYGEIEAHEKQMEKLAREQLAQQVVSHAMGKNILEHNPFINKLTAEQVHAAHLYFEKMQEVAKTKETLRQVAKKQREYRLEKKDMMEALKFPVDKPVKNVKKG